MAFLDWTTTEMDPRFVIIHEFFGPRRLPPDVNGTEQDTPSLDAPITGTGSLVWHFLAGTMKGAIFRTADPGVRSGYIRTRWNVQCSAAAGVFGFGMYCCASQTSLLAGSGSCYLVAIRRATLAHQVALYKSTVGVGASLNIPPNTLLAISGDTQWAPLQTFSTELRWRSHDSGVVLTYSQGFSPNYADLTPILEAEDAGAPLASSVQQGFWAESVSFSQLTLFMDKSRGKLGLPDGIT